MNFPKNYFFLFNLCTGINGLRFHKWVYRQDCHQAMVVVLNVARECEQLSIKKSFHIYTEYLKISTYRMFKKIFKVIKSIDFSKINCAKITSKKRR